MKNGAKAGRRMYAEHLLLLLS